MASMQRKALKSFAAKAAALSTAALVLASCYLPVRFDAEIELDKAGYYSAIFDGYIAHMGLYNGLVKNEISPEEEQERIAVIERDFLRDSNTKEFQYYREGHFKVNWERSGDLLQAKTVTFLRRNELIFQLKYVENSGYIVLEGKSLTQENRQRIQQMGLNTQGQIRVKTDMPIKSHNANVEKKDPNDARWTWLAWDIDSIMTPRPRAVFIIE